MALYPYKMQLVVDPDNPRNIVAAGVVSIYDSADLEKTTLLELTDPQTGGPLSNPISSNANGFTPPFVTTSPEVLWVSGPYTDFFQSYQGMRDEAVAARAAAESAAATAGAEAAVVAEAAIGTATADAEAAATAAATAATNAASSATAAANAAALVGAPADSAIAAVVGNSASATKAALNATILNQVAAPISTATAPLKAENSRRWAQTLMTDLSKGGNLPAVAASPATMVVSGPGGVASPIAGAVTLAYGTWDLTSFVGGPHGITTHNSVQYSKNMAMASSGSYPGAGVEFDFDGNEFCVKIDNVIAGKTGYWVFVDDVPQSAAPLMLTDGTGTVDFYRVRVTFPSAARRRIKIFMVFGYFGGIEGLQIYQVSPVASRRLRCAVVADSWGEGALSVPEFDLWPNRLMLRTGWDVGRFSQGGTGYVNPGTAPKTKYGSTDRIAKVVEWKPDLIIVFGSQNDDANSATLRAEADALYAAFAQQLPNARVIVVGPPRLNVAPPASRRTNNDTLRAAAAAAPNVVGYLDQMGGTASVPAWTTGVVYAVGDLVTYNAGVVYQCKIAHTAGASFSPGIWKPISWIVGTGKEGATTGDGPADRYVGTDGLHMNATGHDYISTKVLAGITDIAHTLAVA